MATRSILLQVEVWYEKYELSLIVESHSQFLDHENNFQNTKVSLNHLSDHLIILSCHLSDNLIIKKFSKQSYQHRKSTFGYILQKEDFWNTSNAFLEFYVYCRLIKT